MRLNPDCARVLVFWLLVLALTGVVVPMASAARAQDVLHSYAIVNDDATMVVRGRLVRLYGLYIPEEGQICGRTLRPVNCGTRAAVALNLKVRQFVRCEVIEEYTDGSVGAFCAVGAGHFSDGDDLGAHLIRQGLALAGPDAPFEYQALERIAAANGRGIWGFQVDSFSRRQRGN